MRSIANPVLARTIGRDLHRRPAQALAVAMTVMLGVLLFVASYDSFRNLSASYEHTYTRLHFADLTATATDPVAVAAAVRETPAVAGVSVRVQADVPMTIRGAKLLGRITGLPDNPGSGVDAIALTSGHLPDPAHPDQVVVEHHTASTFGLRIGDTLQAFDGSTWNSVSVAGIARSPEYLWPARSRQDVLDDPHSFAIMFAPDPDAVRLAGQPGPNQVLTRLSPAASRADYDRVVARMREAGAVDVTTRADQPSDAALHEDLDGFSEIAIGFPLLFLIAAGIAEYVLITRLVRSQRPVIGTLLAMGARRRALVRHYTAYGIPATAVGAVAGVLLGALATSAITAAYTHAIGIPDTIVEHRVTTAAIGLVLGLVTGALAGLVPALSAARTAPAQAMRGDGTRLRRPGPLTRLSARWTTIPVIVRMALRSLIRDRRRTAATMTGTVLAMVLILASAGMVTSMTTAVRDQFGQVDRQDATVLTVPGAGDLTARLQRVPGIAAAESSSIAPVTVRFGQNTYSTQLRGLHPGTTMHGFRTVAGSSALPAAGVIAGSALAGRLHVHVGDMLTVTTAFGTSQQMRLAGLVDEPMGTLLYARESDVRELAPAAVPGYLLQFTPGADRAAVRAAVTTTPGILTYTDTRSLQTEFDNFLGLFWVFIGVMLALGAALSFTVIYVTMTVNLTERTTELATLRAAGTPTHRLTAALALENLTATILATPLGLAAGTAISATFLRSFNSDMFTLHLSLGVLTPTLAVVAAVAAAALSQLPALRFLDRIDIARVVRERAL